MIFFKSTFNGIGTGAGVAWPLFGIAFTLISGVIGGPIAIAFGFVAIGLFMAVSAAIFYFSYQQMQKEEGELIALIQKNEDKLISTLNQYLNSLNNNAIVADEIRLAQMYQALLNIGINVPEESLSTIKSGLKKESNTLEQLFLNEIRKQVAKEPIPIGTRIIPAFCTFVGIFGSIAGCSAGVSGLLGALGVFSGFAAVPVVGWAVLAVATSVALFAAVGSFIEASENYKTRSLNQTIKSMYQSLKKLVPTSAPSNDTVNSAELNSQSFPPLFPSQQPPSSPQTNTDFIPKIGFSS